MFGTSLVVQWLRIHLAIQVVWYLVPGQEAKIPYAMECPAYEKAETSLCWQAMVFPVVMYGCESWTKEGWASKNWCFWIVVLEKTLESLLDCKEIKPVNPKGNQPWIFIGRSNAEAPILWPPDTKSQLIGKDPDAGKDWMQKENGVAEDEMVR